MLHLFSDLDYPIKGDSLLLFNRERVIVWLELNQRALTRRTRDHIAF